MRIHRSLSVEETAKQLGVSAAYIRLIEQGKRAPAYETAIALLNIVGAEIDTFGGTPEYIDDGWVDLLVADLDGEDRTAVTFTSRVRARRANDENYIDWLQRRSIDTDSQDEREFIAGIIDEESRKELSESDPLLGSIVRRLAGADKQLLGAVDALLARRGHPRVASD